MTAAYGNDDDYIATQCHTPPMTKRTTTIRHGSQTMVSMHERKQARRNRGGAHLPSPLISLIQNPGATSLWATWQPNDERRPAVVVRCCCIFYNSTVSTHPINLHSTPPPTTTAHRTAPNNTGNAKSPGTTAEDDDLARQQTCHVIQTVTTQVVVTVHISPGAQPLLPTLSSVHATSRSHVAIGDVANNNGRIATCVNNGRQITSR